MQIAFPSDFIVYSEEKSSPESRFEEYGLTFESVRNYSRENNILLDAGEPSASYEITILMFKNSSTEKLFDLNLYSEEYITDMKNEMLEPNDLISYTDAKVKQGEQVKYFLAFGMATREDAKIPIIQYVTVYNGRQIVITLDSYQDPIPADVSEEFERIIDSVWFTKTLEAPADTYAEELATADAGTGVWGKAAAAAVAGGLYGLISYFWKKNKKKSNANIENKNTSVQGGADFTVAKTMDTYIELCGVADHPDPGFEWTEEEKTDVHAKGEEPELSPAYCRICGTRLYPDSVFCHVCGAKTTKENGTKT